MEKIEGIKNSKENEGVFLNLVQSKERDIRKKVKYPFQVISEEISLFSIFASLIAITILSYYLNKRGFVPEKASQASTIYYVDTNGNDNGNGSEVSPWRTIQKAVDSALPGSVICVKEGEYQEGVVFKKSGTEENYITIKGCDTNKKPKLTGGKWFAFSDYGTSGVSHISIEDFEINGGDSYEFGFFFQKSNNIKILRNKVVGATNTGISITNSSGGIISENEITQTKKYSGIWGDNIRNYEISKNITYNNNQNGLGITHNSSNIKIIKNISYNNSCGNDKRYAGIAIEVSSSDNLVANNISFENCHSNYLTNSSANKIINNTFYGIDNRSDTAYQILMGDWENSVPERNVFKNNILYNTRKTDYLIGNFKAGLSYNPLNNIFEHNLYYVLDGSENSNIIRFDQNFSFLSWRSKGLELYGIFGDPKFLDPQNKNFKITSNSPAIDKGETLSEITDDFENTRRPQGNSHDIGSFEFFQATIIPSSTTNITPILSPTLSSSTPVSTPTQSPSPKPTINLTSTPTPVTYTPVTTPIAIPKITPTPYNTGKALLSGKVLSASNNQPLSKAYITVYHYNTKDIAAKTTTNNNGYFSLKLDRSIYTVKASKNWYYKSYQDVNLANNSYLNIMFYLRSFWK